MILEALQYAATRAVTPKEFRPHVRYSVNLWARANRCAKAWAEHENNSRQFVLQSTKKLKQRRTAVVLGSGVLRDVPHNALVAMFDTVVMVDLVHLASVQAKLRVNAKKNVRIANRDLSGFDDLLAGRPAEPLDFLRRVPYLDLVVSANLLSQIGTGAQHRLEREKIANVPDDLLPKLIQTHLDALAGLPCKVCLVTDTAFDVISKDGSVQQHEDLLHGIEIAAPAAAWDWPLAPFGEESRDYRIVHHVIAREMT
ncbi:hypothetical protein [Agrobacterium tumefaciens]|uniref:hypothetical protein n=1 Tax=Agrobacterium tumefaciens TaxID=358 RepID=UPI001572CEE3|nr:hypothetical protein [Agrobacterium tumefaciens]WCJ62971.1 hypothetical protein G6M15_01835 [Agrobacterium tumefaciens]